MRCHRDEDQVTDAARKIKQKSSSTRMGKKKCAWEDGGGGGGRQADIG